MNVSAKHHRFVIFSFLSVQKLQDIGRKMTLPTILRYTPSHISLLCSQDHGDIFIKSLVIITVNKGAELHPMGCCFCSKCLHHKGAHLLPLGGRFAPKSRIKNVCTIRIHVWSLYYACLQPKLGSNSSPYF